jgi:hypothetical protein
MLDKSSIIITCSLLIGFLLTTGCTFQYKQTAEVQLDSEQDVKTIINKIVKLQDNNIVILSDGAKSIRVHCTTYNAVRHTKIKPAYICFERLISMPQVPACPIKTDFPYLYLSSREFNMDGVGLTRQRLVNIIERQLQKKNRNQELVVVLADNIPKLDFDVVMKLLLNIDGLESVLFVGSPQEESGKTTEE